MKVSLFSLNNHLLYFFPRISHAKYRSHSTCGLQDLVIHIYQSPAITSILLQTGPTIGSSRLNSLPLLGLRADTLVRTSCQSSQKLSIAKVLMARYVTTVCISDFSYLGLNYSFLGWLVHLRLCRRQWYNLACV